MKSIKELVKGTTVSFRYYFDGALWYGVDGKNFIFPVPVNDIGNASFNATDKGLLFMRYIRKHIKNTEKD